MNYEYVMQKSQAGRYVYQCVYIYSMRVIVYSALSSKNLPRRCETKNLVELSTELDLYNSYGKTDSKTKLLTLKSMRICESRLGHKIEIGEVRRLRRCSLPTPAVTRNTL